MSGKNLMIRGWVSKLNPALISACWNSCSCGEFIFGVSRATRLVLFRSPRPVGVAGPAHFRVSHPEPQVDAARAAAEPLREVRDGRSGLVELAQFGRIQVGLPPSTEALDT